jgi:betaine-aldehyde dehydrogenase
MTTYQPYIDGGFVSPQSNAELEVIDPATTEVIARVPDMSAVDVDRAVKAARAAFDEGPWRDITAQDRGRVLFKLAQIVRDRADELAEIETRNSGKPIVEAEFDMADVATCFEYYGGMATKIQGDVLPVPDNAMSLALREPIGVAGQIVPWNYPLLMAAWKMAPAICAGCTVVLKPAEQTPLSVLALASSFHDAGLPPGVVNIVTGAGETAGAAIVEHAGVDKIAFTGSAEVGKIIMRSAAGTLKKISLELGGKSPNIFFADGDFEAAVDGALFGVFINQGEVCTAGSRILVQRPIYGKFVEAMTAKARNITLGHGMDRATKMGPLVSREQFDRVRSYQEIGKREAKLALGGGRASGATLDRGYFVEPTIFYDVDNSSRIAREEIFGPVASVIPFDDEKDALRIANDTYFGLAAAVWTRDIFRALRVVKNLRAGIVWVNHMQPTYVEAPWGGYKQSGIGHELGKWGVEEYLNVKQVYINLSEDPINWF